MPPIKGMSIDSFNKATIISAYPAKMTEFKPGINPGSFTIPPGNFPDPSRPDRKPSALVIGPSTFRVYLQEDRYFMGSTPASAMAQSIVQDFLTSQLGYLPPVGKPGDPEYVPAAHPAVLWVPGEYTVEEFLNSEYAQMLDNLRPVQHKWFEAICRMADDDWNRFHRHIAVSDIQRIAAKEIGLDPNQHEWMVFSTSTEKKEYCPACGEARRPNAVICHACRAVFDPIRYGQLLFANQQTVSQIKE